MKIWFFHVMTDKTLKAREKNIKAANDGVIARLLNINAKQSQAINAYVGTKRIRR